ncbi:MAG: adenylate/guanylate cyclase domain-containing protein [SAR324 cluster bacterium]|nr:adenylate/guanylate cyclase domain-containing protein [SAR324 cluster bacterium]
MASSLPQGHVTATLSRTFRYLVSVFLLTVIMLSSASLSLSDVIVDLSDSSGNPWYYRWGESPVNAQGQPAWTLQPDLSDWELFSIPGHLTKGINTSILWLRTTIPDHPWKEPSLYIEGDFRANAISFYVGHQFLWSCQKEDCLHHDFQKLGLMVLDETALGKDLLIRMDLTSFLLQEQIRSKLLISDVKSMPPPAIRSVSWNSRADNLLLLLRNNADHFMLGSFLILVGVIQLSIVIHRNEGSAHFALGSFILCGGIWIFLNGKISKLFLYDPWYWKYLWLSVLLLGPLALCAFFEQIFGAGIFKLMRRIWQVGLLNYAVSMTLVGFDILSPQLIVSLFEICILIGLGIPMIIALVYAFRGDTDAKIFMLGLILLTFTFARDSLIELRILPGEWKEWFPWGMSGFIITLGMMLENHFSRIHHQLEVMHEASDRFIPHEFLQLLNKDSIMDVELGDHVEKNMTILFADIRSFTSMSENMTPDENFHFINSYLNLMGPVIREHKGFIDKYIGDAIMALFDQDADDALKAGIAMLRKLPDFNHTRGRPGRDSIKIGIGLNTGPLMLGTVGEEHRMEGTVISDSVNLASRMESMTKIYGASLLISDHTFFQLRHPHDYTIRMIDQVTVKGKKERITVWEVLDGEPTEVRDNKFAIEKTFAEAITLYHDRMYREALPMFHECLMRSPDDRAVEVYIERCEEMKRLLY